MILNFSWVLVLKNKGFTNLYEILESGYKACTDDIDEKFNAY